MCIQAKMKIRRNNHLMMGKRFTENCVVIFAFFLNINGKNIQFT